MCVLMPRGGEGRGGLVFGVVPFPFRFGPTFENGCERGRWGELFILKEIVDIQLLIDCRCREIIKTVWEFVYSALPEFYSSSLPGHHKL